MGVRSRRCPVCSTHGRQSIRRLRRHTHLLVVDLDQEANSGWESRSVSHSDAGGRWIVIDIRA